MNPTVNPKKVKTIICGKTFVGDKCQSSVKKHFALAHKDNEKIFGDLCKKHYTKLGFNRHRCMIYK